jgi:hypothetical protein
MLHNELTSAAIPKWDSINFAVTFTRRDPNADYIDTRSSTIGQFVAESSSCFVAHDLFCLTMRGYHLRTKKTV